MRLIERWRAWKTRTLLPVELKKQSVVLRDLVPLYHQTQPAATKRQHKPLLRYPRQRA